jgi:hypothetical protein
MKLLDLLRKPGILRFGVEAGTYTNAADLGSGRRS